jgi:hypothetical protein
MTNRIWTNPPSVYEVTNPSAHMIKRITKIVQSMFSTPFYREPTLSGFLSAQVLSSLLLVNPLFGFWVNTNIDSAENSPFMLSLVEAFLRFFSRINIKASSFNLHGLTSCYWQIAIWMQTISRF